MSTRAGAARARVADACALWVLALALRMLARASIAHCGCSPRPARDNTARPPLRTLAQLAPRHAGEVGGAEHQHQWRDGSSSWRRRWMRVKF